MTGLNRKISYSLLNSADGQFSINELSGIIQLEKPLDRELQAVYTLTLKAVDHGLPRRLTATGTIVISVLDINDNPPVFEYREYGATVSEDVLVGTEVLQVYAASRDIEANAEITYSIISGNEHGKFSIDSKTGNLPLKWEGALILPERLDCSALDWSNDRSHVVSRYPKKEKTQVSFVLLSEVEFTVV